MTQMPVVATRDGVVQVGVAPIAPAGIARVPILGGYLSIDPADPTQIPHLTVVDIDEAFNTVVELYGRAVADRCADPQPSATVTADPAPDLNQLRQLGVLRWLATTAPWPFDSSVHAMESAVLQHHGARWLDPDLLPGNIVDLADDLLEVTSDGKDLGPAADLVQDAVDAMAKSLPSDDPRLPRYDKYLADPRRGDDTLAQLDRLLQACTPVGALAAGPAETDVWYTDSGCADWIRTRLGNVDRDEQAVTWAARIDPDRTAELSVSVAAMVWPEPLLSSWPTPTTGALEFTVHVPSWPLPLAAAPLVLLPQPGTWAGMVTLAPEATDHLRRALTDGGVSVDVHDADVDYRPSKAADATVAAAYRWAARGICAARLASDPRGPSGLESAAAQALHRAARLWRACRTLTPRAAERAAACDQIAAGLPLRRLTATVTELTAALR